MLKQEFPENAFGSRGCPKIFMTDDSAAEKKALEAVWPEAIQLLCQFHCCQSCWRWLWCACNHIEKVT